MGGPSKKLEQSQIRTADAQTALGQDYAALGKKALGTMDTLYAAPIAYNEGIVNKANAGDYSGLVRAAGPAIGTLDQQFDAAKGNIMNTVPQGPGRDQVLAGLPVQEAGATAGVLNQGYQGALDKLTQMGASYGGVGLQESGAGLSGYSGAASTYGNVANQQAQGKASTMSFLGSLAGGVGTAIGGRPCWIAEALYGADDIRTHILRAYLLDYYERTPIGALVVGIYRLIGKPVGWCVARSRLLQAIFRPLFDGALDKAVMYRETRA